MSIPAASAPSIDQLMPAQDDQSRGTVLRRACNDTIVVHQILLRVLVMAVLLL